MAAQNFGYWLSPARDAVFAPHLNQIWIDANSRRALKSHVLAHELYHFFSSSGQPSSLLPLRDYLVGKLTPQIFRCFDDIVEIGATLALPVLMGRSSKANRVNLGGDESTALARKYLRLAERLSEAGSQPRGNARREARRALNFLLMHVLSYRPGNAEYVLRILERRRRWPAWPDRWTLFFELHSTLLKDYASSPRTQTRYHLSPPVDIHRSVGEMFVFLSGALRAAEERPLRVLRSIPALLSVFSIGSFLVLPVVRIKGYRSLGYRADIAVIHATSRGERLIKHVLDVQSLVSRLPGNRIKECPTLLFFGDLVTRLGPLRRSNDRGRMPDALKMLMEFVAKRAVPLFRTAPSCPGCRAVLGDHAVAAAGHHSALMPPVQRAALLGAARQYEYWLQHNCIRDVLGLQDSEKVRSRRRYRYL